MESICQSFYTELILVLENCYATTNINSVWKLKETLLLASNVVVKFLNSRKYEEIKKNLKK